MPTHRHLPPVPPNEGATPTPVFVPVQVTQPIELPPAEPRERNGRLKVVGALLGGLVTLAVVIWGATQAWAAVSAHTRDEMRHLDPAARMKGGDVAYQSDLQKVRADIQALRQDLHGQGLRGRCSKVQGDGFDCVFRLPREDQR